jgi:hypothetical protein
VGITYVIHPEKRSPLGGFANGAFLLFVLGVFLSQWLAMWLSQPRPRR